MLSPSFIRITLFASIRTDLPGDVRSGHSTHGLESSQPTSTKSPAGSGPRQGGKYDGAPNKASEINGVGSKQEEKDAPDCDCPPSAAQTGIPGAGLQPCRLRNFGSGGRFDGRRIRAFGFGHSVISVLEAAKLRTFLFSGVEINRIVAWAGGNWVFLLAPGCPFHVYLRTARRAPSRNAAKCAALNTFKKINYLGGCY